MDSNELAEIYDKYSGSVFRLAYSYLRDRSEAEDIMQEVFIKRLTCGISFESEEKQRSWLLTVTANMCRDIFRSLRFRYFYSAVPIDEVDIACEMPEESAVFSAVMQLPEKYRVVIHLYYYEEYPIREIAKMISKSETAVQTLLYRARAKLKKSLGEELQL